MPEEVQCQEEAQGKHASAPICLSQGAPCCMWDMEKSRREEPPNLCPFTSPGTPDAVTAQKVMALHEELATSAS